MALPFQEQAAGFFSSAGGRFVASWGLIIGMITVIPVLAAAFTVIVPKGCVYVRTSKGQPLYRTAYFVKKPEPGKERGRRLKRKPLILRRWLGKRPGRRPGRILRHQARIGLLVKRKVLWRNGPGVYWRIPYFLTGTIIDIREQSNPMGVSTLPDGNETQHQLGLQLFWRRDIAANSLVRSEFKIEGFLEQVITSLWDSIITVTEGTKESPIQFVPILERVVAEQRDSIRKEYGVIIYRLRRTSRGLSDAQIEANARIKSAKMISDAMLKVAFLIVYVVKGQLPDAVPKLPADMDAESESQDSPPSTNGHGKESAEENQKKLAELR